MLDEDDIKDLEKKVELAKAQWSESMWARYYARDVKYLLEMVSEVQLKIKLPREMKSKPKPRKEHA